MTLTENDRFELKARAFKIITGKMAPGKDVGAAAATDDREERAELWRNWIELHGATIEAMLTVFGQNLHERYW